MKLKENFKKIFLIVFLAVLGLTGLVVVSEKLDLLHARETVDLDTSHELHYVIIDNEGYKKDNREAVELSHSRHYLDYNVSCWDCHHEYQGERNIYSPLAETKKCIDCHDPVFDQSRVMKLRAAYHINCMGCHRSLAMQRKKTASYRECPDCH